MAKTDILKPVKASTAKPNYKPPLGDKNFGIGPYILFYVMEDGDTTEEG